MILCLAFLVELRLVADRWTDGRTQVGMVELCAKNLQIMRNDFTDYARTFWKLCALFANYAQIMRNDFKDYARTLPIMRTFHVKS